MNKKVSRIPAILYILFSVIAIVLWLIFLFFAFFLGGNPGPGYDRTVPLEYVGIISFGLLGAILGLVSGIKGAGKKAGKPAVKILSVCAAVLGTIGSVPFFLMELPEAGVFVLMVGILPSLLFLFLTRKHTRD